jgi:tetratricopeptide (TPR) repeat protein
MTAAFLADINALIAAGRHSDAETVARQALALQPNDASAFDALGVSLYFQNRLEESVEACRRALALDRNRANTWFNFGTSLSDAGYPEQAVAAYRQCLALDPANESANYNLARALLLLGQWDEGWRLYEARGRKKNPLYPALDYARWTGEPPGPYVLLLTTEQGIGDAIQFTRFAGHLRRRGYEVLLWTAPLLAPLLKGSADVGHVFAGNGLKIEGAPVKWSPLMSVPAAIALTPETVPGAPYLTPDPTLVARWAKRVGADGYRIGIVWQGNAAHGNDARRSMPLSALKPLSEIADVRLISLQKRPGTDQLADSGFADAIETFSDDGDFSAEGLLDTAAIMANLDLIVSVDTMAAHLAGALGRQVWLALDDRSDWRWLLGRNDTPWYPSMRLFRQERRGDWNQAVAAMVSILRK